MTEQEVKTILPEVLIQAVTENPQIVHHAPWTVEVPGVLDAVLPKVPSVLAYSKRASDRKQALQVLQGTSSTEPNPAAFPFVSIRLRQDANFVREALGANPSILPQIAADPQGKKHLVSGEVLKTLRAHPALWASMPQTSGRIGIEGAQPEDYAKFLRAGPAYIGNFPALAWVPESDRTDAVKVAATYANPGLILPEAELNRYLMGELTPPQLVEAASSNIAVLDALPASQRMEVLALAPRLQTQLETLHEQLRPYGFGHSYRMGSPENRDQLLRYRSMLLNLKLKPGTKATIVTVADADHNGAFRAEVADAGPSKATLYFEVDRESDFNTIAKLVNSSALRTQWLHAVHGSPGGGDLAENVSLDVYDLQRDPELAASVASLTSQQSNTFLRSCSNNKGGPFLPNMGGQLAIIDPSSTIVGPTAPTAGRPARSLDGSLNLSEHFPTPETWYTYHPSFYGSLAVSPNLQESAFAKP